VSEVIITVLDANGKTITTLNNTFEKGINKLNIDTEDYSPGIYFISLTSNNVTRTQKFLKE